ncbi:hypothetical protein SNOG_04484 [Parastagonospora nodorum SN15]|uniref:Uncharacterized protein n=1 Tax=Phaeosphaeria nodorum (strain SN15 / ATCC MYA-4574 / FGSC 10173) TaxID=321614 RepID=Q0UUT0_PHANO|nr:hypothetical protein SNOG_04484 [Parastagonospora nodorum SN15]EAT88244.1 hypothetical protein SNOG_04484 [Parastagonospora nodorum SN15]
MFQPDGEYGRLVPYTGQLLTRMSENTEARLGKLVDQNRQGSTLRESGDGQCETRFAGCEWMLVQSVVMAAEESGLSRPYSGLHQFLVVQPGAAQQHRLLHAGSALSEGKRCSS